MTVAVVDYVLTTNAIICISSIHIRIVLTANIAVVVTHLTVRIAFAYIVIAVVATSIPVVNFILMVRTNSWSSFVSSRSLVNFRCHMCYRCVMSAIQMECTTEHGVTAIMIVMMHFVIAAITKVCTIVTAQVSTIVMRLTEVEEVHVRIYIVNA